MSGTILYSDSILNVLRMRNKYAKPVFQYVNIEVIISGIIYSDIVCFKLQ